MDIEKKHIPNLLTVLRLILAPITIIVALFCPLWVAGVLFTLCCITDFLDGYLARKWRVESAFGKTFDPVADKVLILGTLVIITFALSAMHVIGIVTILLIVRDVVMDILRLALYSKKKIIPASLLAKAKTVLQMVGVALILFSGSNQCGWFTPLQNTWINWLYQIPLILALIFSWVSFILYLRHLNKKT